MARHGDLVSVYDKVAEEFDRLLLEYGYEREGNHYRVVKENEQTITLFCILELPAFCFPDFGAFRHLCFGIRWLLRLLRLGRSRQQKKEKKESPFSGAARLGDISHLYAGGEEPSFACRFCETFGNTSQRH